MPPRKPLSLLASTFAACIALAAQASAATYEQNFDGFADGTIDLGDGSVMAGTANVVGEKLELTRDGIAGGFASFSIPALADSALGWTATFDLTISDGPGDGEPADGLSLNYGDAPLGELGSAEEGMAGVAGVSENISFEIDTWMNIDAEQGVNLAEKVGGVDTNLAFTNGSILADGTSVSGEVVMEFHPAAGLSFSTTGLLTNADFAGVATAFAGNDDYNFIFSARVGGANETVLIDNLRIITGSPDTDGDELPDAWELIYDLDPDDNGLNPNNNGVPGDPDMGADGDPDMDTLTNEQEFALGTFPNNPDTDMDGLNDNVEDGGGTYVSPMMTGTNPRIADTDGDLYLDGVEDNTGSYTDEDNTGTDPNNADSDADGLPDGSEIGVGRDPNVPDAPAPSSRYVQDFDGYPDGATVLGDGTTIGSNNGIAQVIDGALRLTSTATGSTRASFRIPALPGSSTGWTATFDMTLTDAVGGNPPADGFSFNYGAIPDLVTNDFAPDGHGAAEAGHGTGNEISFVIDTWENGNADNQSGVSILQSGGVLPDGRVDGEVLPNDGSLTVPVEIQWNPTDATFITTGLTTDANFENLPHTFVGDDSYSWVFSARTGGATEDLIIDNLEIRIGTGVEDFRILSIEKTVVPGEGGSPDTISVTVTWVSQEGSSYGVYAAPDLPTDIFEWEELDDSVPGVVGAEQTSFTETGIPIDTERRFYQVRDTTSG